jgi:hypothetical protein
MLGIALPNFVKARQTAQINACISNLLTIDGAKQQWALENKKTETDTPTREDISVYLKNSVLPVCPAGGTYEINPVGTDPTCSIASHRLPLP